MGARATSLLLLLLLTARPEAAWADAAGEALERAAQAGARCEWDLAAAGLRVALADAPGDYQLWLAYAEAQRHARAWPEAAVGYRRAAEISDGAWVARLGLADALLGGERYAEARTALEPMVAERPGDAALLDRLALALFWLGDLDGAERRYREAQAAAPGDRSAELGLAWVAQRRGDAHSARSGFQQVLSADPDNAVAKQGLAAVGRPWHVTAGLASSAEASSAGRGPTALSAYGLGVAADATLADRWLLGLRYRHLGSLGSTTTDAGPPGPLSGSSTTTSDFAQDEGYLWGGYATPTLGVAGHLALVSYRGEGSLADSAHSGLMLGLSGHAHAWADFTASVTYSRYDDLGVLQGEAGAAVPLWRWFSLYAGGRVQAGNGSVYPSALGELRLTGTGWGAAVGGGYGDQLRPVDLATNTLYNTSDTLRWRAYARESLSLTPWLAATLAYEYEWYALASSSSTTTGAFGSLSTPSEAGRHRLTAGLTFSF